MLIRLRGKTISLLRITLISSLCTISQAFVGAPSFRVRGLHQAALASLKMSQDPARRAATERALRVVQQSAACVDKSFVWNFSFGANINPWKLETKRGIKPAEAVCACLSGYRLFFNHRGGFGNIEPVSAGTAPKSLSPEVAQPDEVHGILLKLKHSDFGILAGMEHQYDACEVRAVDYNGREVTALAFVTNPQHQTLRPDLLPTKRYIDLIRTGAKQMGIKGDYCAWLDQVPSVADNGRGQEYYQTVSTGRPGGAERGERGGGRGRGGRTNVEGSSRIDVHGSGGRKRAGAGGSEGRGKARSEAVEAVPDEASRSVFADAGSQPAGMFEVGGTVYVSDAKRDRVVRSTGDGGWEVVAGGGGKGSGGGQLNRPWRIFVSGAGGWLFVADRNNNRVQRWPLGAEGEQAAGTTVAGGGVAGSGLQQLDQPVDVFVLEESGDVFVSDRANHRVVKWAAGAACGEVVAGGNGFGSRSDQLACPAGIWVSRKGEVYVADEANDRIMLWREGAARGERVAGGVGPGGGLGQLYHPLGVWVDEAQTELLVADSLGYRVVRFPLRSAQRREEEQAAAEASGALEAAGEEAAASAEGEVVAGGACGAGPRELGQPMSVRRVADGSVLVSDPDNGRVQRLSLLQQEEAKQAAFLRGLPRVERRGVVVQGSCEEWRAGGGYGFVKVSVVEPLTTVEGEQEPLSTAGGDLQPEQQSEQERGGIAVGTICFAHHSDIKDPGSEVTSGYPGLRRGAVVRFEAKRDQKWGWRCAMMEVLERGAEGGGEQRTGGGGRGRGGWRGRGRGGRGRRGRGGSSAA